jgi:hypothetical protein
MAIILNHLWLKMEPKNKKYGSSNLDKILIEEMVSL